jgi:flagellar hook protein FlgE
MGITSALVTGLSGLSSNQSKLDVVGNNIANVNTVGFKCSRMDFKTQFSQSFSPGSAPNGVLGGTNPMQVGMGVSDGGISRDFSDGSRETTGVPSNLALEGPGFFILQGVDRAYSRDGNFKLNSLNTLINLDGMNVQGYGVDANFNIIPGTLQNLVIPLTTLTVADPTTKVTMSGNLNTNGVLPTRVAGLSLDQSLFATDGAGGVSATAPDDATLLTDLVNASGNSFFTLGDTLTLSGTVGSRTTDPKTLDVTNVTTLADLAQFMNGTLGINTDAGANGPIATAPGVSFAASATDSSVMLTVAGNPGAANDLTLDSNTLAITNAAGTTTPFTFTKNSSADGESVATATTVYDSLGTPVQLNLVASLMSRDGAGAHWQFYATSPDGTSTGALTQNVVGRGTLDFDTNGRLAASSGTTINIDRTNTGASPNLAFQIDFSSLSGLTDTASSLATSLQDGSAMGVLNNYSIDQSGMIMGSFSNGLTRTLGQIALATFRNNEGLVDKGNNTFGEGPNSGTAVVTTPGSSSVARIIGGALELSNVDLSEQFVQLISASTGFSSASRIISTSNQLLQELLNASR